MESNGVVGSNGGFTRLDWLMVLGLFAVAFSGVLLVTFPRTKSITDLALGEYGRWFESDSGEFLRMMSDRNDESKRVKLHPLFPLITLPPTRLIMAIGGLSPLHAVFVLNAATAGVWAEVLYAIMRLLDCRRGDSLLFTSLAGTSGAAFFWFIVPETYPLGSLTILVSLLLMALSRRRRLPDWALIASSAASLSILISNWMAGVITTFLCKPPRRAVVLSLVAAALVAGLAASQRLVFPRMSGLFFSPRGYADQKIYLMAHEQGGPLEAARVIFLTAEVTPRIDLARSWTQWTHMGPQLTIQHSGVGSSGAAGKAATVFWMPLLAAGAIRGHFRAGRQALSDRPWAAYSGRDRAASGVRRRNLSLFAELCAPARSGGFAGDAVAMAVCSASVCGTDASLRRLEQCVAAQGRSRPAAAAVW